MFLLQLTGSEEDDEAIKRKLLANTAVKATSHDNVVLSLKIFDLTIYSIIEKKA